MRIALATNLPALCTGGVEVLLRELVQGLSTRHQIILASADSPTDISKSPLAACLKDFIQVPKDTSSPSCSRAFANDLRALRVDFCHFHLGGTYGWKSGFSKLSPVVQVGAAGIHCFTTNHQATSPFDVNRAGDPIIRRIASFFRTMPGKWSCLQAVEREFLVSDHDLLLSKRCFPLFSDKFRRIYHSCLEDQAPVTTLPDSKIILNLATVCFRKGQHVLTRAFSRIAARHPDWSLHLVGRHAEMKCVDAIRRIARESNLEDRIILAGATSEPRSALSGAEIYVQPSLLEGLGLSLQEAMFLGRPCIGSQIGGIPELIDHGTNGLLVPPDDDHTLASVLAKLISDRSLREKLGEAARLAIPSKGMTSSAMLNSYLELYQTSKQPVG